MNPQYQEFNYSSSDGLNLYGRKYGWRNDDHTPLLCLSGLTRNSDDFDSLATFLASEHGGQRRVITIDYRGRGRSDYDRNSENYSIFKETEDVINGLLAIGVEHVNLLGTSRGGLIAMVLAAARPGIMKSVILNDVGPEMNGPGLVRIKRNMSNAKQPNSLQEAAAGLEGAYKSYFPTLAKEDWLREAATTFKEENGKLLLRYDPKLLDTFKTINLDVPLPTMWPQFQGLAGIPTLLIHGKLSDFLSDDIVQKMRATHPKLTVYTSEHEGHAPLLRDAPAQKAIANFLKMCS
ncbi:MAG: alpha/beta hydrolase [Rhizobiaceae bacterium]|nr:alpha/beta hydrolase [Rhizobiaceae bacterium]